MDGGTLIRGSSTARCAVAGGAPIVRTHTHLHLYEVAPADHTARSDTSDGRGRPAIGAGAVRMRQGCIQTRVRTMVAEFRRFDM